MASPCFKHPALSSGQTDPFLVQGMFGLCGVSVSLFTRRGTASIRTAWVAKEG